jgi:hypothetical protein
MANQQNAFFTGTGRRNRNGGVGTPIDSNLRNRQIVAYTNDPATDMAAISRAVLDPRNDVEFEGLVDEVYSTTAIRITVTLPEPIARMPRFPPGPPPPYSPSTVPPYSPPAGHTAPSGSQSTAGESSTQVGRDSGASEQDGSPEPTGSVSGNAISGDTMASDDVLARPDRSAETIPSHLETGLQQPAPTSTDSESDPPETTESISRNAVSENTMASNDVPASPDPSATTTPSQLEAGLQQPANASTVPESDAPVVTSEPAHVTIIRHHDSQQDNFPWPRLSLDIFSQSSKAAFRFLSW